MPKSHTIKKTRNDARQRPQSTKIEHSNLLNELNKDRGGDQDADAVNENMINAIRHKLGIKGFTIKVLSDFYIEQKPKISAVHPAQFQRQKNALYANVRKATQEFVKSSVSALDNVQAMLLEMRAQEIPFEKYRDDFHVVITSNKESLDNLSALYPSVWKALGQRRSEQLEAASTMLVNNAPRRHEILRDISMKARQQLEQAKQQEKDAEDAAKLIERFKQLLQ